MPVKANSNYTKTILSVANVQKILLLFNLVVENMIELICFVMNVHKKHIIDLLQISGMHNTICGVIVAFGLILVNMRSV